LISNVFIELFNGYMSALECIVGHSETVANRDHVMRHYRTLLLLHPEAF